MKTLKSKIQDWSTCPTTDPATKKVIVDRLQTQLSSVVSSLEAQAKKKQDASSSGLGGHIDFTA